MVLRRQTKPANAWAKFRLLMWKNFLQQYRHRAQTIAELFIPVLTMTLVLILRSQIEPSINDTRRWDPIRADSIEFSAMVLGGMNLTQMSIAYSPESEALEDVVRSGVTKLLLTNIRQLIPIIIDAIPGLFPEIEIPPDLDLDINWNTTIVYEIVRRLVRVNAYNNSAQLQGLYPLEESVREVLVGIEFDDDLLGATELPNNISYALRFPERPRMNSFFNSGGRSWRTDSVFPVFEMPGPRIAQSNLGGNDPGYVRELFIALQHAISSELITRLTGEDLSSFDIHLQRLPHPPYLQDLAVEALQLLFPTFIMLSFSYTAVNIVRAVTVEKELQLKETMKIMGLPTWLHWTAWFCKQILYLLVTIVLVIVILKVNWFTTEDGFSDYSVFTFTPWTVLFFFLTLYLICTIFFCFMISGFFSKASSAALFTGVIWFLTYIPAFLLALDVNMSAAMQALTCLCINSAMAYGFQLILARESTGGMQWGEFMLSPAADSTRFVFGHVVMMLAVDCVLYMLIALYLEQVYPGPFGTPRPWYFPFQKTFWFPATKAAHGAVLAEVDEIGDIMKEKDPIDHEVGVKMSNLTKIFGANIAVNNLSLNIYDDQITVLLGHNGAGKSTTISMLTGNLEVTSGSIWLAGFDMMSQSESARSHLGLCPQHNVLFGELTVREHLEFFARLKGFTGDELYQEIDALIDKLELQEKRDYKADGLSGGQKRRLAVGIALSGSAKVVLLDEPTSGMDPASRRALWDLLQREKKGRSMILTTHFMDEADILGDRVAIMASGRLQCVGSPYFLKQHYGVGYTLVVVKSEDFKHEACTAVINNYIPGTAIKEDRGTEVTYSLTNDFSHVFEDMLNDLEKNIDFIGFKNYGLVATTLEDVFMSVGSDVSVHSVDSDAGTFTDSELTGNYDFGSSIDNLASDAPGSKGIRLMCEHVMAVWMKLGLVWTRSWALIVLQLSVPILIINSTLGFMRYVVSFQETIMRRPLSLAEGFTFTETLLHYNGTNLGSLGAFAKAAYEMIFLAADNPTMEIISLNQTVDEYYLERTMDTATMGRLRNQLLVGATFSDSSVTAWFSNFGYHDIAVSLANVHAALLKAKIPEASLQVFNHPLTATYRDQTDMQLMVQMLAMQLANGIGNSLGIVSAVFIMFYIKERISRAKLLQKAAGIKPVVMWGAAAMFDWAWFLVLCIPIIISCVAFQVIGLSTAAELGRMFLCIMVYGAAMVPINYLFSYCFGGPALGFVVMFFVNVLFGMMGAQIVEALKLPTLDTEHVAYILDAILQFFPLYSLVTAITSLNTVGLQKWSCMEGCDHLSAILPTLQDCNMDVMCEYFPDQCCVRENPYWDWEEPGIARYLVCMVATAVVSWILLMVFEYRLPQKIFNREKSAPPLDETLLDEDVAEEINHVKNSGRGLGDTSLVASGLTKYYGDHLAVNQVSFSVGDTECFGLLGVNGAGKTTTFKMLMGDETVSSGDAFVSGHSVRTDITNVHKNIGYCPQFDAVFGELTGRETLRFFSLLRALDQSAAGAQAEALAHALGFTKHLDKRVDQYSGGNKRKLSTAVALLGRTRLVFVDEPTTGVDPAAKRQVWNAVQIARRAGRGVVLTSHSMEECEALCSRLTIMVNGQFQCLGTPQHLKNKFSQGFTLTIKLKIEDESASTSSAANDATQTVKEYVIENFTDPKIMEEYQGLLTYYLPDRSMAWSRMFGIMERAKRDLQVEDYSISQTTLEQIFLQFTKYQREANSTHM